MSGSKKNCRIEDLQKIFNQKWPDYIVVGSRPNVKGCEVYRKAKGDDQPILCQNFSKNYDLFEAVLDPRYDPSKPWPIMVAGLFEDNTCLISTGRQRLTLEKTLDTALKLQEVLVLYDLQLNPSIIDKLRKIYKKIK
jgi:hypothetical protein